MKIQIIPGIIFILFGIFHMVSPSTIQAAIKKVYINSPFVRSEKSLRARSTFIVLLGVTWILMGLSILVFG